MRCINCTWPVLPRLTLSALIVGLGPPSLQPYSASSGGSKDADGMCSRPGAAKLRRDQAHTVMANGIGTMDFIHDPLCADSRLRVLTVNNAYTRYVPALGLRERFTGADVGGMLQRISGHQGHPKSIRVDQGPEFVTGDLDVWAYTNRVVRNFSRPGAGSCTAKKTGEAQAPLGSSRGYEDCTANGSSLHLQLLTPPSHRLNNSATKSR